MARCEKIRYTSKQARAEVAKVQYPDYRRSYWCGRCKAFHLTSRPLGIVPKRRARRA